MRRVSQAFSFRVLLGACPEAVRGRGQAQGSHGHFDSERYRHHVYDSDRSDWLHVNMFNVFVFLLFLLKCRYRVLFCFCELEMCLMTLSLLL